MLWLKSKGLANRAKHLCWFESIQSRDYDYLSLQRLDYVLQEYLNILKTSSLNKGLGENESINALEICAGQGRNISTILKRLRPYKYVAVDQDQQCILEIQERWRGYSQCEV